MNKIVELLIDWDNLEFDETGVSIMSLVDRPAIGIAWQKFAAQQFVEPNAGETEADFVSRCIPILIDEGYDQDQAAAICYDSYKMDEKSLQPWTDEETDLIHKTILREAARAEFGEIFDPAKTTMIDMSQTEFGTMTDYLKGIVSLDILGRRGLEEMKPETKYRYAGPSAERAFCKAMQNLNKFYTWEELKDLGETVGNGMPLHGTPREFNIIRWKGGPFCKHYFEKCSIFRGTNGQTVIISNGPATEDEAGVTMNSRPRGGRFNGIFDMQFAMEPERKIVTGPAMVPFMMIPRKDTLGNMFHVYFSDETIKKIAQKFLQQKHLHNTDINHNGLVVEDNTLLESWIVEDPERDKASALGFDVPAGTWMVSYKINDDKTWEQIKNGELSGFSIAGDFLEKLQ